MMMQFDDIKKIPHCCAAGTGVQVSDTTTDAIKNFSPFHK